MNEAKLQSLKVLAMDVDGVLTDGGITMSGEGELTKRFNVKDGLGLSVAQRQGLKIAFITGRSSTILRRRAQELNVTLLFENVKDKGAVLRQLAAAEQIPLTEIGFIGDDLIDLPALQIAGVSFAPQDAVDEVVSSVDYTATKPGGYGAVREIVELILKAKGLWQAVVAGYEIMGQGDRQ